MIRNVSYRQNIGTFDVAIFDPPFDIWSEIDYIPTANTYVCFTNFQNRHSVEALFGTPRFEMIWYFKDGRWVSHKMPRHTHEHILIYGEMRNEAYTGERNRILAPQKKGEGSVGRDKMPVRTYIPRKRKLLNSVIEAPRTNKNAFSIWEKPEKLVMPIFEWLINESDDVWDGFAGSGIFGICCKKLKANYFGSEIDKETAEMANDRINKYTTQRRFDIFGGWDE